jgi:hypothetical protein
VRSRIGAENPEHWQIEKSFLVAAAFKKVLASCLFSSIRLLFCAYHVALQLVVLPESVWALLFFHRERREFLQQRLGWLFPAQQRGL